MKIKNIKARQVWDSRGRPTVEVDVELDSGRLGRAISPSGASRGSREAVEIRDDSSRFGGFGVDRAVANVRDTLAPLLRGRSIDDPETLDRLIIAADGTTDKSRIGANATTATSLALWQAAAAARDVPLWMLLSGGGAVSLPMPQIQIFGGGAHADRRVDIQDFLVVPLGARDIKNAFEMVEVVYRSAGTIMKRSGKSQGTADEGGWWPVFSDNEEALRTLTRAIEEAGLRPGIDVGIALDIAASEFASNGGYTLSLEKRNVSSSAMVDMLAGWIDRFPIVSIEDPMGENDSEGWAAFAARTNLKLQVVGDDYLVTSAERIKDAARDRSCNCVLIKVNQRGTVSEAHDAMIAARAAGFSTIVSARSGETEDTTIAHLAVGWDAGQIKVGSFARGERTAKWNELLRMAEAMGATASFAGRTALAGSHRAA